MKHLLITLPVLAAIVTACGSITRTERDVLTVTKTDTTVVESVRNQPGTRDNGIVYPSSRTIETSRSVIQYDVEEKREYPDFIRLGLFEGIGLIGSGQGFPSTNTGVFGLFYDMDRLLNTRLREPTDASPLFSGSIYRFGIGEWRLRIFDDAPGWSWGITGLEMIRPSDDQSTWLNGAGVLTINKRWYLRPEIPYVSLRFHAGFAAFPSQYVNVSGSIDAGSIGGLNLRVYAGYAFGMGGLISPGQFTDAPYLGLGVSMLDFLNREDELEREWKYMEHSAWEIGIAEIGFLGADVERSMFAPGVVGDERPMVTGMIARLIPTTLALPVLNNRLAIGTSLVSFFSLGAREFGLGVLPIRVSYVAHPFENEFVVEPFLEWMYAPSSMANLGVRATLPVAHQVSIVATLGYVSGNTGSLLGLDIEGQAGRFLRNETNFSGIYFSIGAAIFDRLFGPKELRYARD